MPYRITPSIEDRFWSKVAIPDSPNECWIWTAAHRGSGYGNIWINGKGHGAHRVSYQIAYGHFDSRLLVLHHCDVPDCVNPNHLYLGTYSDNSFDMMRRNRHPKNRGERHGLSKLTTKQVIEIRRKYDKGDSPTSLGREYGITQPAMSRICKHERWSHI